MAHKSKADGIQSFDYGCHSKWPGEIRRRHAAAPADDENGLARKVEFLIHAFLVAYFDVGIAIDFTQRKPRWFVPVFISPLPRVPTI
jgi:hypothetical protein